MLIVLLDVTSRYRSTATATRCATGSTCSITARPSTSSCAKAATARSNNIASGHEVANVTLMYAILRRLGKPDSLIRLVADRPGYDRRYALDAGKLWRLDWSPHYPFDTAGDDRALVSRARGGARSSLASSAPTTSGSTASDGGRSGAPPQERRSKRRIPLRPASKYANGSPTCHSTVAETVRVFTRARSNPLILRDILGQWYGRCSSGRAQTYRAQQKGECDRAQAADVRDRVPRAVQQ
jgi:hypothetical protein